MDIKPFYKTSEWWLTLTATIGSLTLASGLLTPVPLALKIVGIVVAVLGSYGYTARRTALKSEAIALEQQSMEVQRLSLLRKLP